MPFGSLDATAKSDYCSLLAPMLSSRFCEYFPPNSVRMFAMMSNRKALLFPVLALSIAACAGKDAATSDSAAAANATMSMDTAPAAMAMTLTDPNIVYIVSQANAGEVARGDLAASKGTNADVVAYGKMVSGEHKALQAEAEALAGKLGVTAMMPAGDMSEMDMKTEMDALNGAAKGAAFDKAYIDYEVTYHRGLLETATKAIAATQNAELKALLEKAAPVVQKHIDRAVEIQGKLGAM